MTYFREFWGSDQACVLDNSDAVGSGGYNSTRRITLNNPTQLAVGAIESCTLDNDGLICWNRYNELTRFPELVNPANFTAGNDFVCARDDTGVVSWDTSNYAPDYVRYVP